MIGEIHSKSRLGNKQWLWELVVPGIFTLILLGCLAHLGYCALQAALQAGVNFHYAISAFAS